MAMDNQDDEQHIQELFYRYDTNKTGAIEIDELRMVLQDLGLLKGRTKAEADAFCIQQFAQNAKMQKNALQLPEFADYYLKITAPKLSDALTASHPTQMEALRQVYTTFAKFGQKRDQPVNSYDLGSAHWMKLCRDTGLLAAAGRVTSVDADLAFMKVKQKGTQRISFEQFIDALAIIAGKLHWDVIDVIQHINHADGPLLNGTVINTERFYDKEEEARAPLSAPRDRPVSSNGSKGSRRSISSAAGAVPTAAAAVYDDSLKKGIRPSSAHSTISSLCASELSITATTEQLDNLNHSKNIAGPDMTPLSAVTAAFEEGFTIGARKLSLPPNSSDADSQSEEEEGAIEYDLLPTFCAFANFGRGSAPLPADPKKVALDSKQFVKLMKDSGLLGGRLTTSAVDLCFTKAITRGTRKLAFNQFSTALRLIAEEKRCPLDTIRAAIFSCSGPRRNSVSPSYVRLFDDKSTYTGVYARGGPQTVDDGNANLAKLLSRQSSSGGKGSVSRQSLGGGGKTPISTVQREKSGRLMSPLETPSSANVQAPHAA